MTVYFTASIIGKKQFLPNYLKIINYLQSKNYSVISDHIIKTTEVDIKMEKAEEIQAFHDRLETWLNSANFVVAETSYPSISVGYEISLAVQRKKPVLILYTNSRAPSLLSDYKEDEGLICEKYTHDTLKGIIDDFIRYAQGTADSRFTFFIPTHIASYLNEISLKKKIPKSVYLRQLIEKAIKNS